MKKVCLFIFSLLVLVTVGCATSQRANYGMKPEMPPELLEDFTELFAFIDTGIKREMLEAQNPDLLEIRQNTLTCFEYFAWDDALMESLHQKYKTHFSRMGIVEFAVKVQKLHNDMDHIKQVCAMLAQEVRQQASLAAQRRNARVAQFNQAARAASTQIQIPNFQVPNLQVPTPSFNMNPLGNPSSSGYMINTDQGLKHGNCTTLPSGMVYCP